MKRVTNPNIQSLKSNEIFVFGSNLSGMHGAGAARTALKWGAKYGNPEGLQGNTYAIPTKSEFAQSTLKLSQIKDYVNTFIEFAKNNPNLIFLVTEIGCGLAGLKHSQIAPMFKPCLNMENVFLPESFINILINKAI